MDVYTCFEQLPVTLCADEVAKVLGISRANAYNLMRSKGFPVVKIGKRRMVTKHDLLKWMSEQVSLALN